MKTLRLCGWAVIFTATLLLAACDSHDPRVADSDVMSGPDTTMSQTEMQTHEDSAIVISQDWLDERERAVEQRELALEQREDSAIVISQDWLDERERAVKQRELALEQREDSPIVISQDWLDERESAVEQRESGLEQHENELVIMQAWFDEHELQLAKRDADLDRRENSLAINQAWLNERETRLARQDDMVAFRQALVGGRETRLAQQDDMMEFRQALVSGRIMSLGKTVERDPRSFKLAGADSTLDKAETSPVRVEEGRCYASVVYPAEYKTVAVIKPIEVPKGENLPVLYQAVTEKVKVTDEQTRWEEILCEQEMTDCRVFEIQRSLTRGGYNPGPIDGIISQQTMAAVKAFQKDFNLTVADHLTVETVNALDANF
jgi:hypothetical protein